MTADHILFHGDIFMSVMALKLFRDVAVLVNNLFKYILKQWIALKARADWFVKLRISCAIYLRAIREKMASRFASVTSEEMIQINFLWCI